MSATLIRQALETALAAMSPTLSTGWANVPFTPVIGTPYQLAEVMFADPAPLEMSGKWHSEPGYLQVRRCYPLGAGAGDALARAELIRSTFKHNSEFTASGVTVRVSNTPQIKPGFSDDERYVVPVWVPFYAILARS